MVNISGRNPDGSKPEYSALNAEEAWNFTDKLHTKLFDYANQVRNNLYLPPKNIDPHTASEQIFVYGTYAMSKSIRAIHNVIDREGCISSRSLDEIIGTVTDTEDKAFDLPFPKQKMSDITALEAIIRETFSECVAQKKSTSQLIR